MDKHSGKVLVVDDNEKNRILAKELLVDLGYNIMLARSGEEGIELTRKHKPDVILLDIMMGGMDGFEMCKMVKMDNNLKDIKVIFVSAKAQLKDKVKGLNDFSADDYLTKPFKLEELAARVKTQCRIKRDGDKLKETLSMAEHMGVIGNMVTSVSHDFNNVLSNIQVFYFIRKYLKEMSVFSNDKEYLELKSQIEKYCSMGERGVDLGLKMVQGLMTFVQGAGSVQVDQVLLPIINSPLKILEHKFSKNKVTVDIVVEDNNLRAVCNNGEIQQIILNFAVNALNSMELSENKKITVKLWSEKESVCFSLTDTGSGITPEVIPNIFKPLFTTKPSGKGTGIGLSTVKKIIDAHKGKIKVDTVLNEGTTFTVILPEVK